jgi:hypothetical protein
MADRLAKWGFASSFFLPAMRSRGYYPRPTAFLVVQMQGCFITLQQIELQAKAYTDEELFQAGSARP